jgi:hypothetical protein
MNAGNDLCPAVGCDRAPRVVFGARLYCGRHASAFRRFLARGGGRLPLERAAAALERARQRWRRHPLILWHERHSNEWCVGFVRHVPSWTAEPPGDLRMRCVLAHAAELRELAR